MISINFNLVIYLAIGKNGPRKNPEHKFTPINLGVIGCWHNFKLNSVHLLFTLLCN